MRHQLCFYSCCRVWNWNSLLKTKRMPSDLVHLLQEKDSRTISVWIVTSVSLISPLAPFASTLVVFPERSTLFKAKNISLSTQLLCYGGRVVHNYNFKDICCLLSYRIQQTMLHMWRKILLIREVWKQFSDCYTCLYDCFICTKELFEI